ncbi:MAG TPA: DolP-mannose mannosyltransferase, partial [Blastocatellia bacterium]|nr:DolP-mannose mannosyltransferase [Blastocatellia bacterium]
MKWLNYRSLLLVVVALAALVYSQFSIWKQPLKGDRVNWEYMSQVIARGGVPYRDAVNIKSPLSAYIGAAAIVIARPLGLRDTYAVRLVSVLMAILTVGVLFLVVFEYFQSLRAAFLAALIFMSFNAFATTNSSGIQPKTPMILFGLVGMWAIKRDLPYVAGVSGMLSALSWQPGLLFLGAAGLAFSRYLTSWRDLKVLKLIAGAAAPLAVLLGYFWAVGALRDFYLWCFHFNYSVYGPETMRTFRAFLGYLRRIYTQYHVGENIFFYIAAFGFFATLFWEAMLAIKQGARSLLDRAPFHAMLIVPVAYILFCRINAQGMADSLPFLPFVAAFASLAIVTALDLVISLPGRVKPLPHLSAIGAAAFVVVCAVIFGKYVADAFSYNRAGNPL